MWSLPLSSFSPTPIINTPQANAIIKYDTSKNDVISYLHATCMSPPKSTWIKAVDAQFFNTWPGLTSKAIKKYLIPSSATTKGHLDQEQKHQLPTQRTNEVMCIFH